jgi:hypothetical protein
MSRRHLVAESSYANRQTPWGCIAESRRGEPWSLSSLNIFLRSIPRIMMWGKTPGASRRACRGVAGYYPSPGFYVNLLFPSVPAPHIKSRICGLSGNSKKGVCSFAHTPFCSGWGTRIRTLIHGVRVRCPTVERSPIRFKKRL